MSVNWLRSRLYVACTRNTRTVPRLVRTTVRFWYVTSYQESLAREANSPSERFLNNEQLVPAAKSSKRSPSCPYAQLCDTSWNWYLLRLISSAAAMKADPAFVIQAPNPTDIWNVPSSAANRCLPLTQSWLCLRINAITFKQMMLIRMLPCLHTRMSEDLFLLSTTQNYINRQWRISPCLKEGRSFVLFRDLSTRSRIGKSLQRWTAALAPLKFAPGNPLCNSQQVKSNKPIHRIQKEIYQIKIYCPCKTNTAKAILTQSSVIVSGWCLLQIKTKTLCAWLDSIKPWPPKLTILKLLNETRK